ncbi:hypothetical protein Gohar_010343 [Gossypium harknessii]|uniref:Uncharacterized protein n=1 Tax=Gossypium harknessii TaxID=34285 RepID=A0A7J9GRZ3_9ROSI|nr:hypothetical protein [Gossypium harknessii]
MANSKIFLTHLRRSIPLSTYYLPHVTHLPLCPVSRSHPNLPARVSPIPYPATRSFFTSSNNVEESILPVRAIVSLLDGYHNLTGFPWWITIVTSTMAMRFALFPVVVIHLQKLKKIGELAPKSFDSVLSRRAPRCCTLASDSKSPSDPFRPSAFDQAQAWCA